MVRGKEDASQGMNLICVRIIMFTCLNIKIVWNGQSYIQHSYPESCPRPFSPSGRCRSGGRASRRGYWVMVQWPCGPPRGHLLMRWWQLRGGAHHDIEDRGGTCKWYCLDHMSCSQLGIMVQCMVVCMVQMLTGNKC